MVEWDGFLFRYVFGSTEMKHWIGCEISRRYADYVILSGLDKDISELEIVNASRNATDERIVHVFLLRVAANQQNGIAFVDALLREIAYRMSPKIHG